MTDAFFKRYTKLINEMNSNKDFGFDMPIKEFIQHMSMLNPQSYGSRIERRIIRDSQNYKVPASLGRGDMKSAGESYYEIKNSIVTDANNGLNLVQIRLWQDVDYYLCIAYDIRDIENFKSYIFLLTHDEMVEQCKYQANAAHGTTKANIDNTNVEMRFSIPIDENNKVFQYWMKHFHKPDFFESNPHLTYSYI
jgi:hypothetical protein